MIAMPLLELVGNSVAREAPANYEAEFVIKLIDTFMPNGDFSLYNKVKQLLVDVAVVSANRNPELVREKLIKLQTELSTYMV